MKLEKALQLGVRGEEKERQEDSSEEKGDGGSGKNKEAYMERIRKRRMK